MRIVILPVLLCLCACAGKKQQAVGKESYSLQLPAPYATKSVMNFSHVTGWKNGLKPVAPKGFTVSLFAEGLDNPRWMYETPNGDILVAESNTEVSLLENVGAAIIGITKADKVNSSANRITLLRDANGDGIPEMRELFLKNLNKPFGMLTLGGYLYVANTDAIIRFPYQQGATSIIGAADTLVNLPGLGRHWTKNIIANADGSKMYIAVGSSTDHAEKGVEKEINRACIMEMNPDGSGLRVFASGLRNPVGMGWAPGTKTLWAAVNERDELGDDLVPDYLTGVKDNGFYGWPWFYYGAHRDPRISPTDSSLSAKVITPDVPLGAHTASLGLVFYTKHQFPARYRNGAFVAQHGSWNRSALSGYKVLFVPFKNGKRAGKPEPFLTGFIENEKDNKTHGRPTGLLVLKDGSMLLTDDKSNCIWRISYNR